MTAFDPHQLPSSPPVMFQRWSHLLFLHWEIAPHLLQARLPNGLTLDTFNGKAYLGIVPFYMEKVRPRFLPAIPGLSWFLELNVRTYVRDIQGRPGVWFFSLDCNQALAVEVARKFFHLPYEHAEMSAHQKDGAIHYACRRKDRRQHSRFSYKGHGSLREASPDSIEYFLLERYLLFSTNRKGDLFWGQVHHLPYKYHPAKVDHFDTLPLEWNEFSLEEEPCSALYSPGPNVKIFPLQRLE